MSGLHGSGRALGQCWRLGVRRTPREMLTNRSTGPHIPELLLAVNSEPPRSACSGFPSLSPTHLAALRGPHRPLSNLYLNLGFAHALTTVGLNPRILQNNHRRKVRTAASTAILTSLHAKTYHSLHHHNFQHCILSLAFREPSQSRYWSTESAASQVCPIAQSAMRGMF